MLAILLCALGAGALPVGVEKPQHGSIAGTVVNASRGGVPVSGAEVALRVNVDGRFVVAAETTSDEKGRFLFPDLPADPDYVYLPGASWQTVHYAGTRVRLDGKRPNAELQIQVRDVVRSPNPLVVRNHRIVITPEQGALRVTESLLVENATSAAYVGQPLHKSSRAATLTLSIPSQFSRVTFEKEFYGRRFTVIDDRLVTDVPWEPGVREVNFTYVLPNTDRRRIWKRPLDLPTSRLLVIVRGAKREVTSNASRAPTEPDGSVAFAAESLPGGHVVEVALDELPVSWTTYAAWGALLVTIALIVLTIVLHNRLRTKTWAVRGERQADPDEMRSAAKTNSLGAARRRKGRSKTAPAGGQTLQR